MRASSLKAHNAFVDEVDEKPIGFDVRIPLALPVLLKRMVFITGSEGFA